MKSKKKDVLYNVKNAKMSNNTSKFYPMKRIPRKLKKLLKKQFEKCELLNVDLTVWDINKTK